MTISHVISTNPNSPIGHYSVTGNRIQPAIGQAVNKLSKKEKKEGWVLLFNGKDFSGWRQCNGTEMPKNWIIDDNAMKVFTGEGKKPGSGANGDILYGEKKFKNFELYIDWKIQALYPWS